MENSFNNSLQSSQKLPKAPPETVTTLTVHQGDSNLTLENSPIEEEEIELKTKIQQIMNQK